MITIAHPEHSSGELKKQVAVSPISSRKIRQLLTTSYCIYLFYTTGNFIVTNFRYIIHCLVSGKDIAPIMTTVNLVTLSIL